MVFFTTSRCIAALVVLSCLLSCALGMATMPAPKHIYQATFVNDSPDTLTVEAIFFAHDGRTLTLAQTIEACGEYKFEQQMYTVGSTKFRYELHEIVVQGPGYKAKQVAPFEGVDSPKMEWWFGVKGSDPQTIVSSNVAIVATCNNP